MSERLAWLEERRAGIGGSDVAALAGLHPYRSSWEVYWDKVLPVDDRDAGEAARWGQLLEDAVADEWARRSRAGLTRPGLIVDAAHPWRRGTPDRMAHVPARDTPHRRVLEVKLASEWVWATAWDGGATIPAHYQAQGQWYAALADVDLVEFAVLVGGRRLEEFTLERDERAIEALRRIADEFWRDHVLRQEAPMPDGRPRTRDALDELYPVPDYLEVVRLGHDAGELVEEYRSASRELKAWGERRDAAAHGLIALLGQAGATDGYLPGDDDDASPAVTYRPVRAVDWASLEAELGPEALEPYRKTTVDTKAAERGLGRKVVDAHRHATSERRIRVRSED